MIKKQMYESPEVELLEVRLNSTLLKGSFDSDNGTETFTDDGDEDL